MQIQTKMAMKREELMAIAADAVNESELKSGEIPPIDLYVDQIINLVSEKLTHGSERYHDRLLTKTMINNYSKDGIITQVKGKKYSKEQILQTLLVYSMKNTLSIGEIKKILQNVYTFPEYDTAMLENVYERFLDIKAVERADAWDLVQSFIEKHDFDVNDNSDYFTLILGMTAMSAYFKSIVQALLEARYPDLEPEKKEDAKRQKEEEKKEKKEKKEEKKAAKAKKDETSAEEAGA